LITGRAVGGVANGVKTEIKTVALVPILEDRETVGVVEEDRFLHWLASGVVANGLVEYAFHGRYFVG
jgi:hypothetical protein